MRQRRKTFAAPFVIVMATACGSKGATRPPHVNPSPPQSPTPQTAENQCREIKEGAACEAGQECLLQKDDECGLNGYRCEDGKWDALMTYCNPPPPGND